MTRQSTVFGGVSSDAFGVWTNGLVSATAGLLNAAETARPDIFEDRRNVSGFLRDGDLLELGTEPTITYRDAAGSTIWTATPTDINGAATSWGGFFLDGPLLYVIAAVGNADFTLYLATIDAAGTINNIATMTPATMVGNTAWDWDNSTGQGRGEMHPIGGTDLAIGINQDSPSIYYFIFNYTTGAIITDTTPVDPAFTTVGNIFGVDKNNIVALASSNDNRFGFFGIEGSPFGTNLGFDNGNVPLVVRDGIGLQALGNAALRFITRLDSDQLLQVGTNPTTVIVSRVHTMDTLTEVNAKLLFQYMGANL